jgi:hypothetical protein
MLNVTFPPATIEVLVASAKSCSVTMRPAGADGAVVELPSAEPSAVLLVAWVEPELIAVFAALEQAPRRTPVATMADIRGSRFTHCGTTIETSGIGN